MALRDTCHSTRWYKEIQMLYYCGWNSHFCQCCWQFCALLRSNAALKSFIIYSHHNFTVLAFCFKSISVPQCIAFSPPAQKSPRVLAQTHSWYFIRKGLKKREAKLICIKICHCRLFFSRTVLLVGTRTLHTWLTDPSRTVLGFLASKLASGRTSVASWSAQPQKQHF